MTEPLLDLPFDKDAVPPSVDVERPSVASRIDQFGRSVTSGYGGARVDYRRGNAGLLLEPERRNLFQSGNDFSTWAQSNVSLKQEGTILGRPAWKVTDDTFDGAHKLYSLPQHENFTFSVFVKRGTLRHLFVTTSGTYSAENGVPGGAPRGVIDLETGDIVYEEDGLINFSVEDFGNDVYRVSWYYNDAGGNPNSYGVALHLCKGPNKSDATYVGDGTGTLYFMGAQMEPGVKHPSSYIPTSGSELTRPADKLTVPGVPARKEATLLLDYELPRPVPEHKEVMTLGADTDHWLSITGGPDQLVGGLAQARPGEHVSFWQLPQGQNRLVYGLKGENHVQYVSGSKVYSDTLTGFDRAGGDLVLKAPETPIWIRSVRLYPSRLPDKELQALSRTGNQEVDRASSIVVPDWLPESPPFEDLDLRREYSPQLDIQKAGAGRVVLDWDGKGYDLYKSSSYDGAPFARTGPNGFEYVKLQNADLNDLELVQAGAEPPITETQSSDTVYVLADRTGRVTRKRQIPKPTNSWSFTGAVNTLADPESFDPGATVWEYNEATFDGLTDNVGPHGEAAAKITLTGQNGWRGALNGGNTQQGTFHEATVGFFVRAVSGSVDLVASVETQGWSGNHGSKSIGTATEEWQWLTYTGVVGHDGWGAVGLTPASGSEGESIYLLRACLNRGTKLRWSTDSSEPVVFEDVVGGEDIPNGTEGSPEVHAAAPSGIVAPGNSTWTQETESATYAVRFRVPVLANDPGDFFFGRRNGPFATLHHYPPKGWVRYFAGSGRGYNHIGNADLQGDFVAVIGVDYDRNKVIYIDPAGRQSEYNNPSPMPTEGTFHPLGSSGPDVVTTHLEKYPFLDMENSQAVWDRLHRRALDAEAKPISDNLIASPTDFDVPTTDWREQNNVTYNGTVSDPAFDYDVASWTYGQQADGNGRWPFFQNSVSASEDLYTTGFLVRTASGAARLRTRDWHGSGAAHGPEYLVGPSWTWVENTARRSVYGIGLQSLTEGATVYVAEARLMQGKATRNQPYEHIQPAEVWDFSRPHNYWQHPFDYTQGYWIKQSGSIATTGLSGPKPEWPASEFVEDTTDAVHGIEKSHSRPIKGNQGTVAAVVKPNGRDRVILNQNADGADWTSVEFDLTSGTVVREEHGSGTDVGGGRLSVDSSSMRYLSDGFYLIRHQFSITGDPMFFGRKGGVFPVPDTYTFNNRGRPIYTGDGASGITVAGISLFNGHDPSAEPTDAGVPQHVPALKSPGHDLQLGSTSGSDDNDPYWVAPIGITGEHVSSQPLPFPQFVKNQHRTNWTFVYAMRSNGGGFQFNYPSGNARFAHAGNEYLINISDTAGNKVGIKPTHQAVGIAPNDGTLHAVSLHYNSGTGKVRGFIDDTKIGEFHIYEEGIQQELTLNYRAGFLSAGKPDTLSQLLYFDRDLSDEEAAHVRQKLLDCPTTPNPLA